MRTAVAAEEPDLTLGIAPATVTGTAEDVGMAYVSGLAASDRSKNGRHYTPAPLAGHLWEMTKRALGQKRPQPLAGRVVDPACGAGALLLPILREHLGTVARVDAQLALAALPNQMLGVDNDPVAVWVANVVLASEMLPILARTERARRRPLPALVRHGDGLAAVDEPIRVTIMNPPYGRVRLDEAERARFARTLYGHANLYGLFLAAALESLDLMCSRHAPSSSGSGTYNEAKMEEADAGASEQGVIGGQDGDHRAVRPRHHHVCSCTDACSDHRECQACGILRAHEPSSATSGD